MVRRYDAELISTLLESGALLACHGFWALVVYVILVWLQHAGRITLLPRSYCHPLLAGLLPASLRRPLLPLSPCPQCAQHGVADGGLQSAGADELDGQDFPQEEVLFRDMEFVPGAAARWRDGAAGWLPSILRPFLVVHAPPDSAPVTNTITLSCRPHHTCMHMQPTTPHHNHSAATHTTHIAYYSHRTSGSFTKARLPSANTLIVAVVSLPQRMACTTGTAGAAGAMPWTRTT